MTEPVISRNPHPEMILAANPGAFAPGASPRSFPAIETFTAETPATPVAPADLKKLPVVSVEIATRGLNKARENVEKQQVIADACAEKCESIRSAARAGHPSVKPSDLADALGESEFAALRVRELRQEHELAQGSFRVAEANEQAERISTTLPTYTATVQEKAEAVGAAILEYETAVRVHDGFVHSLSGLRAGATDRIVVDHAGLRVDGKRIAPIKDAATAALAGLLETPFRRWGQARAADVMTSIVASGPTPLATR